MTLESLSVASYVAQWWSGAIPQKTTPYQKNNIHLKVTRIIVGILKG
jgi:hypothetical protein